MTVYGALAIVNSSACREESAQPYSSQPRARTVDRTHAGVVVQARAETVDQARARSAEPALPRTEAAARRADALARSLCAARERVAAPLARIAASLVCERAWCTFGFARAGDFTREHFGRSGRWLRELAALHDALSALDGLAAALAGDDGGAPLGRRRAILVGRVATAATLPAWLAAARRLTVRELQAEVARARRAGNATPPHDDGTSPSHDDAATPPHEEGTTRPYAAAGALDPEAGEDEDSEDRSLVRLAAPRAVVAAFDEAIDLYRAVEGSEVTVTSFVDALVAEAAAGALPRETDPVHETCRTRAVGGPAPAVIEESLARSTDRWRHLPRTTDASWGLALGRATLARLADIACEGDGGTPAERVARMKELLTIENDIEIHLGRLLASMGENNAWNRLRFAGMAHYAEERLGLSRTAAQSRARAARALGCFPLLRGAYERNAVGLEATLLVGRILSSVSSHAGSAEQAWVRHAGEVTFKRLRDEARALDRSRAFGLGAEARPAPLRDAAWHAALRRAPGTARRRVAALGSIALGVRPPADPRAFPEPPSFDPSTALIPEPDVFLRLTLPDDLAGRFLAAVETARRSLADRVEAIPWHEDWPGPAAPSLLAARTFSIRSRRVPAWAGLLALIEDFVATWDPDEPAADVSDDPILVRDGWRCAAPGCSSRRNLEVHHVVYRSRGGGDEDWNRVTLCRFHHQRGEHGGLARCAGRAPLGLTWRLGGPASIASWYRNERRIASPAEGSAVVR